MKKLCMILPLVFLVCFMVSCQDKEAMTELEKFRARATLEEQNKALVERYVEGINKRNTDIYKELFAPDYAWHIPSNNPKTYSLEEELEFEKMLWAAFPDMYWRLEEIIAVGERVIIRFVSGGTQKGEFLGIPPTGNKYESSGTAIIRVENGKFVENREDYDMLGCYQQLGMELKPKEVKK